MLVNPNFADETTSAMVVSPHITVMIMTHERFKSFMPTEKQLISGRTATEVLLCVGVEKKDDVDSIMEKVEKAGGKLDPTKMPEMEGWYGRSFEDLDGHIWELGWMEAIVGDKRKCEGQE